MKKKLYSTPEVAGWFDITDGQLRYYIKPFEHYIFDDMTDNPTTATVIRLNLRSILKLRMILLLKDEYRVKGLKRLLGIDENGEMQITLNQDYLAQNIQLLSLESTQQLSEIQEEQKSLQKKAKAYNSKSQN
ncbi:hypothetical protein AAGS61_15015 [Lysinibacillus sp. KU-BSD001]|uniref:hypothetical protein n=1 Tax=Lysinibacillus sp. KU-BSD001 TaxID=3141328 RepID=UPI0036E77A17